MYNGLVINLNYSSKKKKKKKKILTNFVLFCLTEGNFPMSSRRQAVDKLDRTITRLYTYLSGSEGEDTEPNATTALNRHHRTGTGTGTGKMRSAAARERHYHEPEYQQPYAYPPSHGIAYSATGSAGFGPSMAHAGGYNVTPTSDHASEMTFTESELALTHQATLPISNGKPFPTNSFLSEQHSVRSVFCLPLRYNANVQIKFFLMENSFLRCLKEK